MSPGLESPLASASAGQSAGSLAVEGLPGHGQNLEDARGAPGERLPVDVPTGDAAAAQVLLHRAHWVPEVVHIELPMEGRESR